MRRSSTTTETVERSSSRTVAKRATTMSPWIPSIQLVEKSLDSMELSDAKDMIECHNERAIPEDAETGVIDLERSSSQDLEEQDESLQEQSSDSMHSGESFDKALHSAGEVSCMEESCGTCTAETSVDDSQSSEWVHKPLKDLIFKTNKMFYDIDSNRVRYKAGLSRRAAAIPSLHQKKK